MTVMNVESIAIELIIPTPDNPRIVKPTDPAVIEMAATMRPPGGQLQPGVARPHPTRKGCYDLRAGMASKLLDRLNARRAAGFATPKQIRCLERFGFKHVGEMPLSEAGRLIRAYQPTRGVCRRTWRTGLVEITKASPFRRTRSGRRIRVEALVRHEAHRDCESVGP